MNNFTITNIDVTTNAVYASYTYNGHELNDTIFVEDATDAQDITDAVSAAYSAFTTQMDALDAAPTLPTDVSALIEQPMELNESGKAIMAQQMTEQEVEV